jgi:ribosomal protein S18 acetylase RimI-like enzyme
MLKDNPESVLFFLVGDKIAGMIEYKEKTIDGDVWGHAAFFYLSPEYRGCGYGRYLDQKMCESLLRKGCHRARLTTISSNKQAVDYYKRMGWCFAGARKDLNEKAIWMQKDLV